MPANEYSYAYLPDIRDEYDDRAAAEEFLLIQGAENAREDRLAGDAVAVADRPDERDEFVLNEEDLWNQLAGYRQQPHENYTSAEDVAFQAAWNEAKAAVNDDPEFHENIAGLLGMTEHLSLNDRSEDLEIWKQLMIGIAAHEAMGYGDESRDDDEVNSRTARALLNDLVPDPTDHTAMAELFDVKPGEDLPPEADDYREEWDRVHEVLTGFLKGRYGNQIADSQGLELANFIQGLNNFDDAGTREWLDKELTHRLGYAKDQAAADLQAAVAPDAAGIDPSTNDRPEAGY